MKTLEMKCDPYYMSNLQSNPWYYDHDVSAAILSDFDTTDDASSSFLKFCLWIYVCSKKLGWGKKN